MRERPFHFWALMPRRWVGIKAHDDTGIRVFFHVAVFVREKIRDQVPSWIRRSLDCIHFRDEPQAVVFTPGPY